MKAKEFDKRIEDEDFFEIVKLNNILKKSLKNNEIFLLIKQKAEKIGVAPYKMAEILLAERLGLI